MVPDQRSLHTPSCSEGEFATQFAKTSVSLGNAWERICSRINTGNDCAWRHALLHKVIYSRFFEKYFA